MVVRRLKEPEVAAVATGAGVPPPEGEGSQTEPPKLIIFKNTAINSFLVGLNAILDVLIKNKTA